MAAPRQRPTSKSRPRRSQRGNAAFHAHADATNGICYRACHDDSGFAIAHFERARSRVALLDTTGQLEPAHAAELAR